MADPSERDAGTDAPFHAPVLWQDPAPSYEDYVLRETPQAALQHGFDYDGRVDHKDLPETDTELKDAQVDFDEFTDLIKSLKPLDAEILVLHLRGHSTDQIGWMLGISIRVVTDCIAKAEGLITVDNLAQLGLVSTQRHNHLSGRYARFLARNLGGLVDARIMRVIVEETHCGLQVMLANGEQMKLWLCSDDSMEMPGWAHLEDMEGTFLFKEEMTWLAEEVAAFVGTRRSETQAAREILSEIAQRAIDLLDELDGDEDLEEAREDWEDESFEDMNEAPLTLQPAYQTVCSLDHALQDEPEADEPEEPAQPAVELDDQVRSYLKEIAALEERMGRIASDIVNMPKHAAGFARIYYGEELDMIRERLNQLYALVYQEAERHG